MGFLHTFSLLPGSAQALLCHQCTTKNITQEQNCMNKLLDPLPCDPSYGYCIVLSQYLVASKYWPQTTCQIMWHNENNYILIFNDILGMECSAYQLMASEAAEAKSVLCRS